MSDLITILGPTASGKTTLAVRFAALHDGEIISADSRQVYTQLDIGSGKDLSEYKLKDKDVPYHLIDIHPVSYEYNLFDYQRDAYQAMQEIWAKNHLPVLCGGTGMYLQAVLQNYDLRAVPQDTKFRESLADKGNDELVQLLSKAKKLHNKTDTEVRNRLLRALEIAKFQKDNPPLATPDFKSLIFGIYFPREELKRRIKQRLSVRFQQGMIAEVENLLQNGTDPEKLNLLGLEYRLITQYLQGEIKNHNDLFQKLYAAINSFAKRQMTWFRKMEKEGIEIHWLEGIMPLEQKISVMQSAYQKYL